MDIDISEEKLDCLNKVHELLERISTTAELAKENISGEFGIAEEDSWDNPISTYDVESYVDRTREAMMHFAVKQICPAQMNFKIDTNKVVKYMDKTVGNKCFDSREVRDYIKREYIDKADELALKEIKYNATKLLPPMWVNHMKKNVEMEDILTGENKNNSVCRLKLYAYIGWQYSFIDMGSFYDKVGAFEKLIDITMSGVLPSEARGEIISTIYWNVKHLSSDVNNEEEELLRRHHTGTSSWVKWVKLFKNGRFDVEFRRHEDALKVGNALIDAQEPHIIY